MSCFLGHEDMHRASADPHRCLGHHPVTYSNSSQSRSRTLVWKVVLSLGGIAGKDSFRGGEEMVGNETMCESRLQAPSLSLCLFLTKNELKDEIIKNFKPTTIEH